MNVLRIKVVTVAIDKLVLVILQGIDIAKAERGLLPRKKEFDSWTDLKTIAALGTQTIRLRARVIIIESA